VDFIYHSWQGLSKRSFF